MKEIQCLRCWKCLWLNFETYRCAYCNATIKGVFGAGVLRPLTQFKHQPDWYMLQKSKGKEEEDLQRNLDEWQLEILL